ncbi:phytanoyl-CoA dioxygenase family protein [Polynucleobacter sp. es-GGE-1]|uniref:phytanoyl-CoA dioxygenase family protein n=1 Tax=Polynucleobacter sp. es-GGE-1 TaxID=1819724 RepID=UPI001C0ACF12|nr:phytanoyl-CoA dioxygenase family protein [Polynucleobacter sp. es-GGE-1]MBU3635532.1 phytanoyl-CoA dioxygenase family protein [Polynucleobacter sp. es-GGE-1]
MKYYDQLESNGYFLYKHPDVTIFKRNITQFLKATTESIIQLSNFESWKSGKFFHKNIDLIDLISEIHNQEIDNSITKVLYELFPCTGKILSLTTAPLVVKILKEAQLRFPVVGSLPLVRLDRPNDSKYETPWHQDFWFSFLSENAVTLWFSLGEITESMGHLKMVPGSHKWSAGKFFTDTNGHPIAYDGVVDESQVIRINPGIDEILVFNQKLLHASGTNISSRTRVSLQLRFNDLGSAKSLVSTFVPIHTEYVKTMQKISNE